jgi:rhamnulokinase
MLRVLAVDMGATSIRVAAVDLDATPPSVDIVHRYVHGPVRRPDGSLRWNWPRLVVEVERGLEAAMARGPAVSIGVDTWGVDYGLLDARGELVSPPYSYRDERTARWSEAAERIGAERLYAISGIQLLGMNTIFQLAAHDRTELSRACQLLMLPELMVHELTGARCGERTSAGTTGLVDVKSGMWSDELLDAIGLPYILMPRIARAGAIAGHWRGVPVHLVGGHDTASAVVAMPPHSERAAFISSGTWMIIGAERSAPDVSPAAFAANFSNEPSVYGGVRFLKNVSGLWLLERCRQAWGDPPLDPLLDAAAALSDGGPMFDVTDARFLAPANMEAEVREAARLPASADRARVVRCILDSLALAAAKVVGELGGFLREPVEEIHVIGGGARNQLLSGLIEQAAGVPVHSGSPEATALGNALAQGIALGRFRDLDDARATVAVGP